MSPIMYNLVRFLCRTIARLLFRARAQGIENVPATGPLLVVSNHASLADPPLVGIFAPRPFHYLAKQELFQVPVLGWLIAKMGSIPVNRGGADRVSLESMLAVLRAGGALAMFPEGTRTRDGNLQEGKPGVSIVATRVPGLMIQPVFIEGSYEAWPRHRPWPRTGRVRILYGKPFSLDEALAAAQRDEADAGEPSPSATSVSEPTEGSAAGNSSAAGGKKQLYSALSREIMRRIALVQRERLA